MNLQLLTTQITQLDDELRNAASKSVNILLTARNWFIGFCIVEYEHSGKDRADYGKSLTKELAQRLDTKGLSARNLWLFRQFYLAYPQIGEALANHPLILQTPFALSLRAPKTTENEGTPKVRPPVALSEISPPPATDEKVRSPVALFINSKTWRDNLARLPKIHAPGEKLLQKLSYTHLQRLLPIEDPLKRTFYEIEAIKGTWSVRELQRQVTSLFFERSGLSTDPALLSQITQNEVSPAKPQHFARDLYAFEFLGLPAHLAVEESDLETALLENLQCFLLEFGHGFCFEARQKRLLIGEEYFFVNLVLYHRILKCHVLIELKVGTFSHENAGQLNTYLNYYRSEISEETDNPPIGILLVADKNKALVEYATANMDENLFVRKYLLQLPSKEVLTSFIRSELAAL